MKNNLHKLAIIVAIFLIGCNSQNESGFNKNASINHWGELPENPLLLNTITTSFHPKDNLVSVLYGNKLAYDYAKINGNGNYPAKAVLYNVTWQLQEDEQWFGANIPQNIQYIERVEFLKEDQTVYKYFDYHRVKHTNFDNIEKKINQLKGIKMAVSP